MRGNDQISRKFHYFQIKKIKMKVKLYFSITFLIFRYLYGFCLFMSSESNTFRNFSCYFTIKTLYVSSNVPFSLYTGSYSKYLVVFNYIMYLIKSIKNIYKNNYAALEKTFKLGACKRCTHANFLFSHFAHKLLLSFETELDFKNFKNPFK